MRLGEGIEWGLHCAVVLAALPAGAALPARALAEFHGVSPSYLLKHLKAMVAGGVLESVPGARGGYRLARPASEITLLDVVIAVEGSQPAFRCTEIRQRGPVSGPKAQYRAPCTIKVAMLRAESAWREALRGQTVAELLAVVARIADPASSREKARWLSQYVRGADGAAAHVAVPEAVPLAVPGGTRAGRARRRG